MSLRADQAQRTAGLAPRALLAEIGEARQKPARERPFVSGHVFRPSRGEEFASRFARARPHVDQPVGRLHHRFVVFNHHDGISLFLQVADRLDEALVVPGMEPHARFVEYVEHARESGAELTREPDPLRFTSR